MIALNNPMNLRISSVAWYNKDVPPRNDQFETFPTAADGLHAGIENILHAQTMHACKSIADITARLSPPNENNTAAYTAHLCDECGAQADEFYDLTIPQNLADISQAIIKEENGTQPYSCDMIMGQVKEILGLNH